MKDGVNIYIKFIFSIYKEKTKIKDKIEKRKEMLSIKT